MNIRAEPKPPYFAPATPNSPRPTARKGTLTSKVVVMRMAEDMHADLQALRQASGIPIQSHVRRAILDYMTVMRKTNPELF